MNKATAERLAWPRRPRRREHDFLGPVQVWPSECGAYCVKRFVKCSGKYLAMVREERMGGIWILLDRHKTLRAAQRTCERAARETRRTRER